MSLKCELCHRRVAKHQFFADDGKELYICNKCWDENRGGFFNSLMPELKEAAHTALDVTCVQPNPELGLAKAMAYEILVFRSKIEGEPDEIEWGPVGDGGIEISGRIVVSSDPKVRKIFFDNSVIKRKEKFTMTCFWTLDLTNGIDGLDCEVKYTSEGPLEKMEKTFKIEGIPFELWVGSIKVLNCMAKCLIDEEKGNKDE